MKSTRWRLAGLPAIEYHVRASAAGFTFAPREVRFEAVAPGLYAFIGEKSGRTYENEGLNANIGLVVTADGALLIDSGASFQGARPAPKRTASLPTTLHS